MKKSILVLILSLACIAPAFANNGEGTPVYCERHGCGLPENQEHPCDAPTPPIVCPVCPTVEQQECPAVVFPKYVVCRRNNDGTVTCPRKKAPRRVLVPVTE